MMENRKRNTMALIMLAALYILLGQLIGFSTVAAIFIIGIAFMMIRQREDKLGYILLIVGGLMLASKVISFFAFFIILLLGFYYLKTKDNGNHQDFLQKTSVLESWRQTNEPWVITDMKRWSVVGEINLDLSLAIAEKELTTIHLEGLIGDVDIIVSEDIGLIVEGSIMLGEVKIGAMSDEGVMNKLIWQSPNIDECETKVKLVLSYFIGDIDIKMV